MTATLHRAPKVPWKKSPIRGNWVTHRCAMERSIKAGDVCVSLRSYGLLESSVIRFECALVNREVQGKTRTRNHYGAPATVPQLHTPCPLPSV